MPEINHASPPVTLVADAVTTDGGKDGGGADGEPVVAAGPRVEVGTGSAVVSTGAVVVVSMSPPVMVGTAYGGSKRPNRPQALHGYAHELTCFGAARMGSHRESTMVAIAEASAVWGQSVPRSLRVSWRVTVRSTMVETSSRSRASIQLAVEGPAGCPRVSVPLAVSTNMYTDGDVKV